MKISRYNSQKIRVLSLVAILMVLYIHAVFNEAKTFPISAYVQEFCAFSGLSFVANPLFFSISGFLFFLGIKKASECYSKIKKRTKTLFVPYIIWNVIFVLWYVGMSIIPWGRQYVNSNIIDDINSNGPIHALYSLFIAPAGFQLWYLRDLMLYVVISPAIYFIIKRFGLYGLLFLFITGSLGLIYLPSEIKIWGAFFFTLGGYIALFSSLEDLKAKISPAMAGFCLVVYILNAVVRPLGVFPLAGTDIVVELCGLIAIWRLYDIIVENENGRLVKFLASLGSYSFFIYLFHEPAYNIIKKLGIKVCGVGEMNLIILYLICPFVMAAVSIAIAKLLQNIMPKVYTVIVGGR